MTVNTAVLPLTLVSFNALPVNNKFIKLVWATENETNIERYVVERSLPESDNFVSIGTVTALHSLANTYQFIDNNVKENITYRYRLRVVETSRNAYSEIRLAGITGKNFLVNISPNPSTGNFKIKIEGYKGSVDITVYNALNKVIINKNETIGFGSAVNIDLSKYAKGIYALKIRLNDKVIAYKLFVQ